MYSLYLVRKYASVFLSLLFLFYSVANILAIGQFGRFVWVPVVMVALFVFCLKCFCEKVTHFFNNKWFFFFLIFVFWLSCCLLIAGEFYKFKQLTIGSTGGLVFFFLLGSALSLPLQTDFSNKELNFFYFFTSFVFLIGVMFLFAHFFSIKRDDIFYISGFEEDYQRPGNFISLIFVFYTCLSFNYVSQKLNGYSVNGLMALSGYVLFSVLVFYLGQLIGSNSAAVVVLILAPICFVFCLSSLLEHHSFFVSFSRVQVLNSTFYFIMYLAFISVVLLGGGFDGLRIFNFNNVSDLFWSFTFTSTSTSATEVVITSAENYNFNSSLESRFDIFLNGFYPQVSYSPIFGDVNVSQQVMGSDGEYLHSFFPYVLSNYGIVGFVLSFFMFWFFLKYLFLSSKKGAERLDASFLFYMMLFILLIANFSVDVSWPVIWFSLGLFGGLISLDKIKLEGREIKVG